MQHYSHLCPSITPFYLWWTISQNWGLQSLTLTASMQSLTYVLERHLRCLANCTVRISHCTSKFVYTMHMCFAPYCMQVRYRWHTTGMNIIWTPSILSTFNPYSVYAGRSVSQTLPFSREQAPSIHHPESVSSPLGYSYLSNGRYSPPQNLTVWWAS